MCFRSFKVSLTLTLKTNRLSLPKSAKAWNSAKFEDILVKEISSLGLKYLPLQQGLTSSSVALDHALKMMVLSKQEKENCATINMGAFYTGIIAGCNCADDPTPMDEVNEYCEIIVCIDLKNGQSTIVLSG